MTVEKYRSHEWVYTQLDQYVNGPMADDQSAAIAEHVAECERCQRRVAELRGAEPEYARGLAASEPTPAENAERIRQLRGVRGERHFDQVRTADLEALAAFHSDDHPVLSLYLDLSPAERQGDKVRAKLKSLIDETGRTLANGANGRCRDFQTEADRLMNWFTTQYDDAGRGLAVFSCSAHDLWRAFRLPAPVRDRLVIADRPYLWPLMALLNEFERYLVLLIDKQTARIFVTHMGEITEYRDLIDEIVPHPKAGGQQAEKYQRHHEMHVLWHVKHAIEVAEKLFARERCHWLVIGGPQETLAELRQHLPKALSERLAGEIMVRLDAPLNDILKEVLQVEQAVEHRVEAERGDALLTAALGHGAGVLGLDETLQAIVEGRVLTLIVAGGFHQPGFECPNCHYLVATEMVRCPLCDTPLDPQVDIVERALERAIEQQASIEVVRGEAARRKMAEHGHIGALLRYNVSYPAQAPTKSAPAE